MTDQQMMLNGLIAHQPDDLRTLLMDFAEAIRPRRVIEILPLAEAASYLHVQPCTLRNLVFKGKIGFIVDGKQYFFKVSDLNDYLNAHYTPAKELAQ